MAHPHVRAAAARQDFEKEVWLLFEYMQYCAGNPSFRDPWCSKLFTPVHDVYSNVYKYDKQKGSFAYFFHSAFNTYYAFRFSIQHILWLTEAAASCWFLTESVSTSLGVVTNSLRSTILLPWTACKEPGVFMGTAGKSSLSVPSSISHCGPKIRSRICIKAWHRESVRERPDKMGSQLHLMMMQSSPSKI